MKQRYGVNHQPINNNNMKIDYIPLIFSNINNSKFLNFLHDVNVNIKDCCEQFYVDVITCDDIRSLEKITKFNSIEWKKARKFKVTGSRCYSIFTYSKNEWKEFSSNYFFSNKCPMTEPMKEGIRNEPNGKKKYMEVTNSYIQDCGLIVCKEHPWLAYSPDGIVIENNNLKLIEVKCPYLMSDVSNENLKKHCNRYLSIKKDGEIHLRRKCAYYGQIQLGMALLNLNNCDFVIYASGNNTIKIINIPIDEEFIKNMLCKIKVNYFNHMLHNVCLNH